MRSASPHEARQIQREVLQFPSSSVTARVASLPDGGKKNILLVSGTRPEIIKLAPVYHALRQSVWANVVWLHTAQHGEMAQQILDSFGIHPDLTLTRPGSSLLDFSLACRASSTA